MSDTREFPTLDVVTVATGVLVSDRHIASVYEVCNWMLDDSLMTHQLPNASRTLEPYILQEHPWILMWDLPKGDVPALKAMCARIVEEQGATVTLTRPENPEWVTGNAMPDLQQIAGARRVIQVDLDDDGMPVVTDSAMTIEILPDLTEFNRAMAAMRATTAEAKASFQALADAINDAEEENA
jgi:hypothetical protein